MEVLVLWACSVWRKSPSGEFTADSVAGSEVKVRKFTWEMSWFKRVARFWQGEFIFSGNIVSKSTV